MVPGIVDPYVVQGIQPQILTMDQILDRYSEAFLDKMLFLSILYAAFSLMIWWNFRNIKFESEAEMRMFRGYLYFNIAASLYFPVLMLGYKTGWFI